MVDSLMGIGGGGPGGRKQSNGSNGFAANHKGYLKNMLVSRLMKKLPSITEAQKRLIESEVQIFVNREYLTKDTMRQLE